MTDSKKRFQLDERQRLASLLANRGTLIALGVAWIATVVWQLARSTVPLFLVLLVPSVALIRLALYLYYCSIPLHVDAPPPGRRRWRVERALKTAAAVLLPLALFLPLYSLAEGSSSPADRRFGYVWDLVADDWLAAIPLALTFLWPAAVLLLRGRRSSGSIPTVAQWLEPLLVGASTLVVLWIPQFLFGFQQFFFLLFILTPARAEAGCVLAVVANGIYLLGWLSEVLRPQPLASFPAIA